MEFPDTPESKALVERFVDFGCSRVDWQIHRWCAWQLHKWGPEGADLMIDKLQTWCTENRATNPPAAAVWCMKQGNEVHWCPRDEYQNFKAAHMDGFMNYKAFVNDSFEGKDYIGSRSEHISELRVKHALTPSQLGVEW